MSAPEDHVLRETKTEKEEKTRREEIASSASTQPNPLTNFWEGLRNFGQSVQKLTGNPKTGGKGTSGFGHSIEVTWSNFCKLLIESLCNLFEVLLSGFATHHSQQPQPQGNSESEDPLSEVSDHSIPGKVKRGGSGVSGTVADNPKHLLHDYRNRLSREAFKAKQARKQTSTGLEDSHAESSSDRRRTASYRG